MCAQIVASSVFCRCVFGSQIAIITLNVISPNCNNQHNKDLGDIDPISYAKWQFLVSYTVTWTSCV